MRPQKQLFKHDPDNGTWGDCLRTCLAIMLDMDAKDVPHFMHGADMTETEGNPERDKIVEEWLDSKGYAEFSQAYGNECTLEALLHVMKLLNPNIPYMLSGTSRNGTNHVVIGMGNKIICDPSLDDSGIIGPCDDGYYWIAVLVPSPIIVMGEEGEICVTCNPAGDAIMVSRQNPHGKVINIIWERDKELDT